MDELFETIFFKALKADSTDIHFKLTDHLSIQFRVFGELQPYQEYEKTTGAKIMNYLKYKSFINVNYKMVPQTVLFIIILMSISISYVSLICQVWILKVSLLEY